MSTRGRRARGRPPKTPVPTNRSNFLRKPKAYQNLNSNVNNTDTPSPLSHYRSNRIGGRGRAAFHKGRQFFSQLAAEDDELSSLPEFENDRTSDSTDLDNDIGGGSDVSFDGESDEEGVSDDESLSTVSSSVSKKKLLIKRPKTPEIPDDKDIPTLKLPDSATDLLFPSEHILQAIGIYEVIRHFRKILRLSPFTFEDFCAALLSDEQNTLISELFITLLKSLLREDDGSSTTFGPQDTKDSVNISLFFMDYMSWPEILRAFLDSEKHPEYRAHLSVVESPDFPFVPYADKLKVLQTLTDLFLATTKVREEIINEGNIQYDDHCRACHKLGDLLCCETCSAVYHLACVEPPMEEVPEDDWICNVCRAHQVKGVTDCVSEAEKSGLLSRQEPIGYDRHARKYWFLCRRIIIEGDSECSYYSTKYQLEELLDSLDPSWESDLISFINEMKDDILKQMTYTEDLTLGRKGSKKSIIEIENAQLSKIQAERAIKKAKEEEERKADEERKVREEEEKRQLEEEKKEGDTIEKDNGDSDECPMAEEVTETVTTTESVVTSQSEEITCHNTNNTTPAKEVTEMTTTITTVVTSTVKTVSVLSVSGNGDGNEDNSDEPAIKKAKIEECDMENDVDKQLQENGQKESDENKAASASGDASTSTKNDGKIVVSATSALAEAIKSTGDGKQKVISLASLLPGSRQGILNAIEKVGDDGKSEGGQTKTVLLVNREGGKVTLQVQRQPVSKENDQSKTSLTQSSTTASASESRKMTTRSKTGSLTPKLFTDSVTMTTNSAKLLSKSTDESLVISKDGETTRYSRSKISLASSSVQQSLYYKLGADNFYKQYQNQYTTNTLALNKHQHNEERDKRRHLSHKFSLTQTSEFKWNGNLLGNRLSILATLRLTITSLESNIQAPFMHSNWSNYKQQWQKAVQVCQTPKDFGLALCVLEACIKPCVFNHVWHESLGHVRLYRITVSDREEWKKKEKEQRRRKEDEDEVRPLIWIKYTLGLKHQIWKLKGEEYRVTGGNGWRWISATRNFKEVPQNTVGLRNVAEKVKLRHVKTAKANQVSIPLEDCDLKEDDMKKAEIECLKGKRDVNSEQDNSMEVGVDNSSGNKEDDDCKAKDSGVKEENMEINGVLEGSVKAECEIKNDRVEGKMDDNDRGGQADFEAEIKDEKFGVEEEEKPVVKKTSREKRLDGIYKDFILFMKSKYKEDEDMTYALELLKKHPSKVDVDVINVSESLQKRNYYPKITKPYSKLDGLLERRVKQDELERKQRLTIETQIALKQKLSEAIETAKKKKEEEMRKKVEENELKLITCVGKESGSESTSLNEKKSFQILSLPYPCYSISCRTKNGCGYMCYSPLCRNKAVDNEKINKPNFKTLTIPEANSDSSSSIRSSKESSPEENSEDSVEKDIDDVEKNEDNSKDEDESAKNILDGEGKDYDKGKESQNLERQNSDKIKTEGNIVKEVSTLTSQLDTSTEDEEVDIEGDNKVSSTLLAASKSFSLSNDKKSEPDSNKDCEDKSESSTDAKNASVSDVVKNLVIKTMAEKAIRSPTQTLSTAMANISIEELKAKLPAKFGTADKVKLTKSQKVSKKSNRGLKNGRLPTCHRFETFSHLKSILVLDRNELRKLARLGSKRESQMFNYNCKLNSVCWPYPCPRPYFKTGWRYRTMTLSSLSAAALQLRILWACLRWDDMAAKPPAGGTNTVSTETEITTTELLKRREVGIDGLRSEFLVRKIVVPLGVADKPKEKYTPQRSGLRERKRQEAVRQTEPSVTEVWVPEEVLELWEIKQFGEKLEKQRLSLQEKAKETTVAQQEATAPQQTAAQIKAQMEQQLKQQRLALAQKRIQESQGIKITTSAPTSTSLSSSNSTTIIINNASKPGSTFKTLTVSSASSLLSSGIIKTMQQPKTIIANTGSLLGGQIRPGIRVQLPGSALQLRPQTITLAPKPGAAATTNAVTTSTGVGAITRLISPSPPTRNISPVTPQAKTQTIQIRPQNTNQPVQNLQFIQQPNGQLQVKGLLPGQIIQRMPDGKLQIISLNTSAAAAIASSSSSTSSSPLTTALQGQARPPAISIRPQQTIMMSNLGSTSANTTSGTPNRLVIPAQLASSIALNQATSSSTVVTLPTSRPILGGTVISSTPQKQMIITRPTGMAQVLGSTPPAVSIASSGSSTLNSAIIISAPSIINPSAAPSVVGSSTATVVNSQQPQTVLTTGLNVQGAAAKQTLISTLRPVLASNQSVVSQSVSTSTTTTTAPQPTSLLTGQVLSGTSLLPRPIGGATSLLNLSTASGGSLTLSAATAGSASTSQIPKLLNSPPVGAQIIRPIGSSQAQLVIRPGSTLLTGGNPAKVITAQQLKGITSATPIQLKPATSLSPIKTILSPPSSQTLLLPSQSSIPRTPSSAVQSLNSQLTLQQTSHAPQQTTLIAMPKPAIISSGVQVSNQSLTIDVASSSGSSEITSPTPGSSPSAGVPKYAITPQVVEQVVRQALLQNQTPEIQQKLLAMQRQIQSQRTTSSTPSSSAIGIISVGNTSSTQRISQTNIITPSSIRSAPVSSSSENRSSKSKGMTPEQKEEQSRNSVCSQVMKSMLDRIEREEKLEQRNKKKQESADEKQKRMAVMNQQKSLFRHKEALKKEILRKRSLMEKNLQQDIYNEMAEKVKRAKLAQNQAKSPTPSSTAGTVTPVTLISKRAVLKEGSKLMPDSSLVTESKNVSSSASRKRKQKIISTGIKSLNPKEKLYCVCKTPYDDTRFYIGCDLCSNWFHGVCVNINEDQAKFIDSYICEDCRKQQENTSEELYCLCRTPYDENQFYIGCDRCQDWFHGYCVGISKNEADGIDFYVCPRCQKEETSDPIAQRPLNQSEYSHLIKLVKDVKVHKMAWPFLNPVDPREVPDYYNIIAEPMDLTIVEDKLSTRSYEKLNDFVKDVTKIFDNCRFYNPVGTPYYQCAEVVETYFAQKIKALRGANKL